MKDDYACYRSVKGMELQIMRYRQRDDSSDLIKDDDFMHIIGIIPTS